MRVELTVKDLRQFSGQIYRKRYGRIGVSILCNAHIIVGYAGVIALTIFQNRLFLNESGPLLVLALVLLMGMTWLLVTNYLSYFLLNRQNYVRRPIELQLTPKGFEWRNDVASGVYDWSAISRIEEGKQYILIFLDDVTAQIIPRRSFDTAGAAKQFLDTARHFRQMAREST